MAFVGAIWVFVPQLFTKLEEVRRLFRSEDNYDALPVSALVDLVTLTFDLETDGAPCWPWCG